MLKNEENGKTLTNAFMKKCSIKTYKRSRRIGKVLTRFFERIGIMGKWYNLLNGDKEKVYEQRRIVKREKVP